MSNIYDCTRHYWANVKIEKAELADYVFGVAHCKVVGVFKPHRWYHTEPGSRKTRIQFEGEEIMDSPYLGMDLFQGSSESCQVYWQLVNIDTLVPCLGTSLPYLCQ